MAWRVIIPMLCQSTHADAPELYRMSTTHHLQYMQSIGRLRILIHLGHTMSRELGGEIKRVFLCGTKTSIDCDHIPSLKLLTEETEKVNMYMVLYRLKYNAHNALITFPF